MNQPNWGDPDLDVKAEIDPRMILDDLNARLLREDQEWEDRIINGTCEIPGTITLQR